MENTTTTTGAGAIAAHIVDAKDAIHCKHDYNKGPLVCYVQDVREARLIGEALGEAESAAHNLLADIAAFVSDIGNDLTMPLERRLTMIRTTIAHDVYGLLADEPCFLPRCNGWRNAGK
jgi:hypothetical protein